MSLTDTVGELSKTFARQILRPGDPGYEEARRVHNGLIARARFLSRRRCRRGRGSARSVRSLVMDQLLIEHFHGAVTRIGPTDAAFPHRAPGYNLLVLAEWMSPKENDACIAWARDSYAAMQPFVGSSRYVNYLADDEDNGASAAAYGPNYRRLQQLKAKYDPENFFHMNQNILPL